MQDKYFGKRFDNSFDVFEEIIAVLIFFLKIFMDERAQTHFRQKQL